MSKQTWIVMMAVVITLGVIVSLSFYLPIAPWRSFSPREITLALPGERVEVTFFELSLKDFQRLPLDSTYYQIYSSESGTVIKALGIEGDVIYRAEGLYEDGAGFNYSSPVYSGDILTLFKTFNFVSYLIWTIIMLIIVAVVCTVIGAITKPMKS